MKLNRRLLRIATRCWLSFLPGFFLVCARAEDRPAGTGKQIIRVGYMANLYSNMDMKDAQFATDILVRQYTDALGLKMVPKSSIVKDLNELAAAVKARKLAMVTLFATDYLRIRDRLELEPVFIGLKDGSAAEEYLLVVRKDSPAESPDQLKGKALLADKSGKGELPVMWLDTVLMRQGLPACRGFFKTVKEVEKPSAAVLPVFFGQADAAIVTSRAFETMAELNPQLSRQLKTLARSPGLVAALVCVRKDLFRTLHAEFEEFEAKFNSDLASKQVLSLFRMDNIERFKPSYLVETERLFAEHRKLKYGAASGKNP